MFRLICGHGCICHCSHTAAHCRVRFFPTSDRCSVSQRAGRRLLMTSQRWQSPPSLDQTQQLFFAQHWRLWWTTGTAEMDSNTRLFEKKEKKKKTRFILIGNHMFFLLSLIKGLKRNARRSTTSLSHIPNHPDPTLSQYDVMLELHEIFPPSTFLSAKFLYLWHTTNLEKTCLHWSLKRKRKKISIPNMFWEGVHRIAYNIKHVHLHSTADTGDCFIRKIRNLLLLKKKKKRCLL